MDFKEITKSLKCRSENQVKCRYRVLMKTKETGEHPSHKKKLIFELETIRASYLEDKMRRIKNVDLYLVNARDTLLNGIDRAQMKKDDFEKLKVKLQRKCLTKLEEEERSVDNEIIKMFDHYNLIPNKFQQKPSSTSADNLYFNEALTNYLDCLMSGQDSKDDCLLSNVIKYLFKNEITDFHTTTDHNSTDCIKQHSPILPPNRSTMLAFIGVLMQKDNLERMIEDGSQDESLQNFDLFNLKNDPEYQQLKNVFRSLFLWPAILTDTQPPSTSQPNQEAHHPDEDDENTNNNCLLDNQSVSQADTQVDEVKKPKKRKNSIAIRQERQAKILLTTKMRLHQKALVDSYLEHKHSKQ